MQGALATDHAVPRPAVPNITNAARRNWFGAVMMRERYLPAFAGMGPRKKVKYGAARELAGAASADVRTSYDLIVVLKPKQAHCGTVISSST
jgi:hypothetical protein